MIKIGYRHKAGQFEPVHGSLPARIWRDEYHEILGRQSQGLLEKLFSIPAPNNIAIINLTH